MEDKKSESYLLDFNIPEDQKPQLPLFYGKVYKTVLVNTNPTEGYIYSKRRLGFVKYGRPPKLISKCIDYSKQD